MKYLRVLPIIFFLSLGFFFAFPRSIFAATFPVGDGDVAGLKAAINTANGNGEVNTINLAPNSVYSLTAMDNDILGGNGLPIITNDLTINGNNAIIERTSGSPQFRILLVHRPGKLNLRNTVVRGGEVLNSNGGGILNWGQLTLYESTVSGNAIVRTEGYTYGGGIDNRVTAEIINSTISDNTSFYGGGIDNNENATISITNSTISDNSAVRSGGGIYNINGGTVTISQSQIINNRTTEPNWNYGGAGGGVANITVIAPISTLSISGSTVSNNTSTLNGGGVYSEGRSNVTIENTTFSGNAAISQNTDLGRGGGMFVAASAGYGSLSVTHSSFLGNTASAYGGGIYTQQNGTVFITENKFLNNFATKGAAYSSDYNYGTVPGEINITNNCIEGNIHGYYNYAVQNESSDFLINAINNWWGSVTGPGGMGSGSGDTVGPYFTYMPFLSTPPSWCDTSPTPTPTPSPTPTPLPVTVTFNSVADSFVRGGAENRNEGGEQYMRIQSSGSNRSLVRFDQSALQSSVSGTVLSAKLRVTITDNGNNWGTTGRTVDIHRLIVDWMEGNGTDADRGTGNGATWSCATDSAIQNQLKDCSGSTEWEMGQPNNPPVHPWTETPSDTQTITNNQTGVVEYDVTSDVSSFLNSTNSNYGWIVKKTEEGQPGQVSFGTKESTNIPQLVVTYQP